MMIGQENITVTKPDEYGAADPIIEKMIDIRIIITVPPIADE